MSTRCAEPNLATKAARTSAAWRWGVVALLFLASVNNYLDRQALSVLAPVLRDEFGLNAHDYSLVVNAFLVAYAVMYAIGGRLIDHVGPSRGIAWLLFLWSSVAMLHGFATGLIGLMLLRFALGLAEPGFYPGAIRMLSGLFPPQNRGLPIGIVVCGASVGAMLAPPLVLMLARAYDWRVAFLVTGASGFVLWAAWLALGKMSGSERAGTETRSPSAGPEEPDAKMPGMRALLRTPAVRAYMLTRMLGDPAWYYIIFWLPDYLIRQRGFSLDQLAQLGWLPYAGLDLGVIAGGLVARSLIRNRVSAGSARVVVAMLAAGLFSVGLLASLMATGLGSVLALIAVAVFAIGLWMATIYAIPGDLLPLNSTATVVGLGGSAGSVGGMGFAFATGRLSDNGLYDVAFVGTLVMFALSVAVLTYGVKRAHYSAGQ